MSTHAFFHKVLSFAVALLLLAQLFVSLGWMRDNLAPIIEDPNRSYDEKMRFQLDGYYELMQFVQRETPRDATLWIDSAEHVNLDLYFLFPRKIYYASDLAARMQAVDYLVLTGEVAAPSVEGEKRMLDDKRGVIRLRR